MPEPRAFFTWTTDDLGEYDTEVTEDFLEYLKEELNNNESVCDAVHVAILAAVAQWKDPKFHDTKAKAVSDAG